MRIAAQINKLLNLGAAHAFYFKTGNWYHVLKRFPGVLIDSDGYVRFETEEDYNSAEGVSINRETNQVHIARSIAMLPEFHAFTMEENALIQGLELDKSAPKTKAAGEGTSANPLEVGRVNVREPYEVAYWCQVFNCTPEELAEAVAEVGPSPEEVRNYLLDNAASLDAATQLQKISNREAGLYEDTEDEQEELDFSEYDITAAPNDFNTKTLYDFISSGIVKIPGFQRNYVWDLKRASKLIESLIIGLPIPQIFLYQEAKNRFIVIDGQQRYMTIYYFMKKRFPRKDKRFELRQLFNTQGEIPESILSDNDYFTDFNLSLVPALPNQTNKFNKKNYATLDGESRTSFDLRTIRNVIVKQNYPDDSHSAVYEIFNRLNSGGVNLKPQEIRTSLYHSEFYNMLYDLNMNRGWRKFTPQPTPDLNMKDIEILLRGFAMLEQWKSYTPSMTRFLNSYSESAKRKNPAELSYFKLIFDQFIIQCSHADSKLFFSDNNRFSISFFESVFVASCYKCFEARTIGVRVINEISVSTLKRDPQFVEASKFDTASSANVRMRIQRAIDILNPETAA